MLFGNIVYSDKLPVCVYMYLKNDGSKGVVVMLRLRYTIFFCSGIESLVHTANVSIIMHFLEVRFSIK